MKKGKGMNNLFMLLFAIVVIVAGCKGKITPVAVPVVLPAAFSQSGSARLNEKWWYDFADPALNELVDQGLHNNFSLQSSWDRLNQARAVLRKNRSSFFPTFNSEAKVTEKSYKSDGLTTDSGELTIGAFAQYELDLWGRIRSTAEAARLDMEATRADLDAAAVTLAAEVAATWFTLIEQHNEIALVGDQLEANEKALEVLSSRFKTGQVVLADMLQQQQLVESKKGELASLIAEKRQSEHALAILVGKIPGSLDLDMIPKHLPSLSPLPDTGIPAEIILLRPDVRSALHAVEAADQRVAAAVADRFPTLRLTATLSTTGRYTSNLFSDYIGSFVAGLAGPIIDGGRRKAEVERARFAASAKLNYYGQVLLIAIGEVENALITEQQQQLYLASLQKQLVLSKRTVAQARFRYMKGVENYQRVLTATTSQQGLEKQILKVKRVLLLNRIQLCKAIGSGWQYSGQAEADYKRADEQ